MMMLQLRIKKTFDNSSSDEDASGLVTFPFVMPGEIFGQ